MAETPVETFEASLRLNLRTTYVVCHAAIPHLADDGAIVCTSSATAHAPFAGSAGYAASKAGVTALAKAIAKEGTRCNVLSPSLIDTPANRESMPESSWSWCRRSGSRRSCCGCVAGVALNGAEVPV